MEYKDKYLKVVELVEGVGKDLVGYQKNGFKEIQKSGVDFTTEADIAVQNKLAKGLDEITGWEVLGEEGVDKIDQKKLVEKKKLWVVDPLDGTINFSRQDPLYAISVGLVSNGQPEWGVVRAPATETTYWLDETGVARKGEVEIGVSKTTVERELVVGCDWSWDLERREVMLEWIRPLIGSVRQVRAMGSAALALAWVAEGKMDAYIHTGLKPWDVAAGAALVRAAGGEMATATGETWNVFDQEIVAGSKLVVEWLVEKVRG